MLPARPTFNVLELQDFRALEPAPPLWIVAHGDRAVGPVNTNRLLRGVLHDRIPQGSFARVAGWRTWRAVDELREVRAMRRAQGPRLRIGRATFQETLRADQAARERVSDELRAASDPGEVLLIALAEAVRATGALVGLVHRRRTPYIGLVASCAHGPGASATLGEALTSRDPAIREACRGRAVFGTSGAGPITARIAERLGSVPAAGGVAMVPIVCTQRLYAVLELGRPDHPFRHADRVALRRVLHGVVDRLETIPG